jgi:hypothetical protein
MYGWLIKQMASSGDDLYGFEIDIYQCLCDHEHFSNLEVESTSDLDHLIKASFNFDHDVSEEWVISKLRTMWLDELRYSKFEIHQFEQKEDEIIMNFCTRGEGIGVTGKIVAQRTPAER